LDRSIRLHFLEMLDQQRFDQCGGCDLPQPREDRVGGEKEQEQIQVGEEPSVPVRIERVAVVAVQEAGDAQPVVLAVGIIEQGLGPKQRAEFNAAGQFEFGLIDVPENPGRLESTATLASHLFDYR